MLLLSLLTHSVLRLNTLGNKRTYFNARKV